MAHQETLTFHRAEGAGKILCSLCHTARIHKAIIFEEDCPTWRMPTPVPITPDFPLHNQDQGMLLNKAPIDMQGWFWG